MADIQLLKSLLAAALLCAAGSASAALGAVAPSPLPAGTSSAPAQTAGGSPYTVLRRVLDTGTTIREYVGQDGKVFAVAWAGPLMPDLRSLLGDHFALLEQHAAAAGRTSAVSIHRPEVTILSAGRMGNFQGRAWLSGRLPPGFDPRELQ